MNNNIPSNTQLLQQIRESKEQGAATRELTESMITIIHRICNKPNFKNSTYIDEGEILLKMIVAQPQRTIGDVTYTGTKTAPWENFRDDLSSNPFAYFVQCVTCHVLHQINREKRELNKQPNDNPL